MCVWGGPGPALLPVRGRPAAHWLALFPGCWAGLLRATGGDPRDCVDGMVAVVAADGWAPWARCGAQAWLLREASARQAVPRETGKKDCRGRRSHTRTCTQTRSPNKYMDGGPFVIPPRVGVATGSSGWAQGVLGEDGSRHRGPGREARGPGPGSPKDLEVFRAASGPGNRGARRGCGRAPSTLQFAGDGGSPAELWTQVVLPALCIATPPTSFRVCATSSSPPTYRPWRT